MALAGFLALGFGAETAFAKPKIEVLGLEVINPGGGQLDPQVNVVAKELTDAFRARAPKGGPGKYELAPNSDKELVDEKLIANCDTELPACMVPIGQAVGAQFMIYGRMHKEGGNYVVDLVLLNVNTKSHERNLKNQILPIAEAQDSVKLTAWAKKTYAKLVEESSLGTIVVEVTNDGVEGGDVQVDNEPKGTISNGRLPIPNLSDGKHHLVIEVGGFQRFEKDVTVTPNERNEVSVTLTKDPKAPDWKIHSTTGSVSESNHTNAWRGMFIAGTLLAAASGAYWIYENHNETKYANMINSIPHGPDGMIPEQVTCVASDGKTKVGCNPLPAGAKALFSESLCDVSGVDFQGDHDNSYFQRACRDKTHTAYGIAGFSVGAVVMVATFYSAFIKNNDSTHESKDQKEGRRKTKPSFAITPIVSPDGGGATLRIDW